MGEQTFEDFLRECLDQGHTQVKLVPRLNADNTVSFYAVGQCGSVSSETFNSFVGGNVIEGPEEVATPAPVENPGSQTEDDEDTTE